MFLHLLLLVSVFQSITSQQCTYTSWQSSFDSLGQSKCKESDYYMNGLDRNSVSWSDDPLDHLEGVDCCRVPQQWANTTQHVTYEDWTDILDKDYQWANCKVGYFLQGLYRSNTGWPRYKGYLFNIEAARCTKPATHPLTYGTCKDIDITNCINRKGKCSCPGGYFMTGIYRADGDDLYFLKKIRCCTAAEKPLPVEEAREFKSRIMDTTFYYMSILALYLGYEYCAGCRGMYVGEDFYRNGDTWVANTRAFYGSPCDGYQSNQRLNMVYSNWALAVKEIKYGNSVIDELQPDSVDSGEYKNLGPGVAEESIDRSRTVEETITHTTESNFRNSHELGLQLSFAGASISYKTTFENSFTTTSSTSISNIDGFTKNSKMILQPNQGVKFNVILSKSRTTIPYTAVVIAKFTTEFRGFLRWSQGSGNFHRDYIHSTSRPTFNYRFGESSTAFYTALKKQSDDNIGPWLWNLMIQKYPHARHIINELTNESQYEFTLRGKLEKVKGTRVTVIWEPMNVTRRDVAEEGIPIMKRNSNKVHIARTGPGDKPVKVEYPEV